MKTEFKHERMSPVYKNCIWGKVMSRKGDGMLVSPDTQAGITATPLLRKKRV
ncbi:MAG: hypothetical protein IKY62_02765 [Clostridia bacterium]|nr:hypothetical protein [Clostridia bacterium]